MRKCASPGQNLQHDNYEAAHANIGVMLPAVPRAAPDVL